MTETVLVTGATGYIASRLIPRLLDAGYQVRCLARSPERLRARKWYPYVQVVAGDVTRHNDLVEAMRGADAAYYLVHSMSAGSGYDRLDLQSARNFAFAARDAGIQHIIYLGGLADPDDPGLVLHMKSRIESGQALREAGVPVTEFRAGVIVGPGSVSFEMIRFITEQLPLLVGPSWLSHRSQPIAAGNVLDYLVAALTTPAARGKVIEIGCLESQSYIGIMTEYARLRGLLRFPILVPFIPLKLMTFLIDLMTPVKISYAIPLVEGLQNDSLVRDRAPLSFFPQVNLLNYTEAVRCALAQTNPSEMERVWLDLNMDEVRIKHEGMFVDYHRARLETASVDIKKKIKKIAGGGLRIGLLSSFIQDYEDETTLRLKVAQKIPGQAWLEWSVTTLPGKTLVEQTVFFAPRGLPGFLLWYLLAPFHKIIFADLLRRIISLP